MATSNLPKIVVIKDISPLSTPEMISEALGVVFTGDPDATTPPVTDVILHGEAATLQTIHSKRQTSPPTATSDEEEIQRNILARAYKKNADYLEGVANDVAVAAGDVNAGEAVVLRIGMKLKKEAAADARTFEVYESGVEWVHIRCKAVAKRAAYIWRYGVTTAKDIPPATLVHPIVTLQANLLINGLESGEIYGFQFASVVPSDDPEYTDGTDPHIYSDFIYFAVQ
jgi:hypothetical protein